MGKNGKKRRAGQVKKWNALLDTIRRTERDYAAAALRRTTPTRSLPGYEAHQRKKMLTSFCLEESEGSNTLRVKRDVSCFDASDLEIIAKGRVVAKYLDIRLGTTRAIHESSIKAVAAELLTFDGDGETLPIDTVGRIVQDFMEFGKFCVSKPSVKAMEDKHLASCPRVQNFDGIDPEEHPFLYSVRYHNAIVYVPANSVSRGDPAVRVTSSDAPGLTNAVTTAAASVQVTAATEEGTANSNS
jgi:hypothetical protein